MKDNNVVDIIDHCMNEVSHVTVMRSVATLNSTSILDVCSIYWREETEKGGRREEGREGGSVFIGKHMIGTSKVSPPSYGIGQFSCVYPSLCVHILNILFMCSIILCKHTFNFPATETGWV